jgi:DNA-directed RNA polymerase specialized sigma24 family protein
MVLQRIRKSSKVGLPKPDQNHPGFSNFGDHGRAWKPDQRLRCKAVRASLTTPSISRKIAKCDRRSGSVTQNIPDQPLNLISTMWSLVRRAHDGPVETAKAARQQLLERYGGAVQRYLTQLLHDADAVSEVYQEFALQLVHGKLRGADPHRGRFRDFVKGTLFHLVADYRRVQRGWPGPLPADGAALVDDPEDMEADRLFVESWRDELLARTWAALADIATLAGRPYYAVLRFRADHPDVRSPQIAERLSTQFGKPLTAAGVRQILHRAREKFADLLLEEVANSMEDPSDERMERELIALGLFEYCRPALERRP